MSNSLQTAIQRLSALALSITLGIAAATAAAHDGKQHQAAVDNTPPTEVDVVLYDETLLDQDGREVRLVTDVIADRLVIMNFIYTTCTTVCPVLSAIIQQVQGKLAGRLGEEVVIVSVSVDPTTDTPTRLKAYAEMLKAQPGWVFLTGGERVIDKGLEGVGAYSQDFTAHPNMTLIGDGGARAWTRMYGFADPNLILAEIDRLVAARPAEAPDRSVAGDLAGDAHDEL